MRQSVIAGRVGLTRATANRILWRYVAIGTLVPPRNTTPRQNRRLLRMVQQDRLPCLRTHTETLVDCQPPPSPLGVGTLMSEPDNGPLAACHLRWGVQIPTLLGNGRPRVRRLPGECFQQRCQPDKVQAGGGSVHDWGAFHSGAKPPLVLLDRYLTGELYRGILWNTLVLFAIQHFGDNYRYQDDDAISHCARVVCEFKCGELALRTEEVWLYH